MLQQFLKKKKSLLSDSAFISNEFPRNYVRTTLQTTIFLAQNYAYASTTGIFLLKTLHI